VLGRWRFGFSALVLACWLGACTGDGGDAGPDGAAGGSAGGFATQDASTPQAGSAAGAGRAAAGSSGSSGRAGGGAGAGRGAAGSSAGSAAGSGAGAGAGAGAGGEGSIPRPNASVDDPNLSVEPWNGHRAAVSFTFDDADPTHYELAGPILDEREIHATFYLVANTIEGFGDGSREGFRALHAGGHELGNHTMSHKGSSENDASEFTGCDAYIEDTFGTAPVTFAYPNGDVTGTYKDQAAALYVASRNGGNGDSVTLAGPDDWHEVTSPFSADPENDQGYTYDAAELMTALDDSLQAGAWRVLTFHGIGDNGFFANTSPENLAAIADHALDDDFWIETFARVAGYLRAQLALQDAAAQTSTGRITWTWMLPQRFPQDVVLRVVIDGGTLTQDGAELGWNGQEGFYPVDPKKLELTWTK
jgi:peptidoglycan/xylan/chitin deacetylase (PgdA/CDA1 family)